MFRIEKGEVGLSQCWAFLSYSAKWASYCCMAAPCDFLPIIHIFKSFYLKSFFFFLSYSPPLEMDFILFLSNGSVLAASLMKRSSLGSDLALPFSSSLSTFSRLLFAGSSRTDIC